MALPVVSAVVNKLGNLAIQEALLLSGFHEKADLLRRELQGISSFLEDADGKQKYDAMVKNWVREIREIAYDVEDIIDEFMLELERHRFRPRPISRHSIGRKFEDIKARIEEIANRRAKYGIGSISESSSSSLDYGLQWRRSWPHINDDVVVGFENDAQTLLERLLDPGTHRKVVSIVGMGGIGKTTLAAKVFKELSTSLDDGHSQASEPKSYRDEPEVRNAFEVCVWVSVTHDPDIDDLLAVLTRDVMKKTIFVDLPHLVEIPRSQLVGRLFQLLRKTRYLIVMDDLWRKDIWDLILEALPDDKNGSRVVLTTRSIEIAMHADSDSDPYHLQPLNDEKSRQLLLKKAFPLPGSGNPSTIPAELEDLSWQLTRKCGGLPLALVVIGGLLSGKAKHPTVWLNLVNSMVWESTEDGKQCLQVLALSYNDLPHCMKLCFLYFSAFPQGSDIRASKLIELWTAEGLIVQEEGRTMEETAEYYLEDLIQRCLVQASKRGSDQKAKRIRLHDLLRELSISEARECRFFHVRDPSTRDLESKVEQEMHRLSLHHLSLYDASQASITLKGAIKLRALMVFHKRRRPSNIGPRRSLFKPIKEMSWIQISKSYFRSSSLPSLIAYKSISNFEFMRVLDLEGMHSLIDLPQEIEKMTHLRYLDLRDTNLKELPQALTKLKLHTLNIRGTRIAALPDAFWSVETLRHLYLNNMLCPPELNGLINLQTLDGVQIEEALPELTNLRKLGTAFLSDFDTLYSLRQMVHLVSLKLRSHDFPQDVFTAISVHQTLQNLKLIGGLSRTQLPDSMEFPRYLTKLTLDSSELAEDPMPQLERLLSLRILELSNDAYLGTDMICSSGGFPRLHCLHLNWLPCLSHWRVEQGAMPSLTQLSIRSCMNLEMLPEGLSHIITLQELTLEGMDQLLLRLKTDEGEDWCKIAHVPSITIIS